MNLIIHSTEFPPGPGGIGTHAYQLASRLNDCGWSIYVLTPQDYASDAEIEAYNACQTFTIERIRKNQARLLPRARDGVSRLSGLVRAIKKNRPDVILASGSQAIWLTAIAARVTSVPWVAVAHGGIDSGENAAWEQSLRRWAYRQPAALVCVSRYTRQQLAEMGIAPKLTEVIPNGADETTFLPVTGEEARAIRQRLGFEDATLLLTVGSVSERKGQEVVIRALPEVLVHYPEAHYLAAGLPILQTRLAALALELGVADHVHFLGRVDPERLVDLYHACDVFIMTSQHTPDCNWEGFGIAVIEAALCGKPAIVSNESGLSEAVIDGETGLSVPESDPQATAEAILRLIEDAELRHQLGQRACQRARQEYTWARIVQSYDRLLRQVIQQGTR